MRLEEYLGMISQTGIHAIRALASLGGLPKGKFAGASDLAKVIGAPPNYLGKLLQALSREGLLVSQKGMGGGFRLARAPKKITLWEIVNSIDPLERWSGCLLGRKSCTDDNPCVVHEQWKSIREQYLQLLKQTTVAEVAHHDLISLEESLSTA
jgi:Rrf2 family protein